MRFKIRSRHHLCASSTTASSLTRVEIHDDGIIPTIRDIGRIDIAENQIDAMKMSVAIFNASSL